jgi:outer membrane protein assembly factor BamB
MITKGRKGNLLFGMGIMLVLLLISSAASASDWEQFQKDKHNSGVTSDKAPISYPVDNGISWAIQPTTAGLGAGFDSTFVVIDDVLYVVGWDHVLRALYMVNGTQIWQTSTNGGGFHLGSIASGNGSIFVPTVTGMIYSINSTAGAVEWYGDERIPFPSNPNGYFPFQLNTPVVYDDHKIYFGGWTGASAYGNWMKYYCYSDNGTKCWDRNCTSGASGYPWTGAAVIDDYLVYGDDGGNLVSVYKYNGITVDEMNVPTEFGVGGGIKSSICYAEDLGRIYFTSTSGYIYSLGMNPDGTFNATDKQYAYISMSSSTPAVYNGRVYVGSGGVWGGSGSGLSCFNASNLSEKLWVFSNATCIQSSPVISTAYDDGDGEVYIYFTTNVEAGTVYCINESGVEQWKYTAPSDMNEYTLQGVTISNGWLFYGNDRSYVFGLATPESLGKVIHITPEDSLQETIYAANNGDTIMMAPGNYKVSIGSDSKARLYINKSDLTFMADGGEAIISSAASETNSYIHIGRRDRNDNTGCDASGVTFKGITFNGFRYLGDEVGTFKPAQIASSLKFENCTFRTATSSGRYCYLYDNSSMLNCTFDGGPTAIYVDGNNTRIEGNIGTGAGVTGGCTWVTDYGWLYFTNVTISNNVITGGWNIGLDSAESLVENNVFNGFRSVSFRDNPDNVTVRNNKFLNCTLSAQYIQAQLYGNVFSVASGVTSDMYLQGGNMYLNNFIGFRDIYLYPAANLNSTTPVTYTYRGQEHTGYLGNYYSVYDGNDINGDGVGDEPLTSSSGGVDYYPLISAWIAGNNEIEGPELVTPVADFSAVVTSGFAPLTVQFNDLSTNEPAVWAWDFDNDGVVDSTEQNPQFTYMAAGTYSVSLTVSNSAGSDTETKVDYLVVESSGDWNPWNDPDSDGGEYITFAEVMEAYGCFTDQTGAPGTGAEIDFAIVMEMYNAFVNQTLM